MALTACKECGKQVSTEAKACPHCGAAIPKTSGCAVMLVVVILSVVVLSVIGGYKDQEEAASKAKQRDAMTPEQREAADRTAAAQAEIKAKKEAAFQKVVSALRVVRSANRNPDSVQWESIRSNYDASIICIEYRGQNGFGGMSKEHVAFVKDKAFQTVAAWNKHCTQPLEDMLYARRAL